MTTSQSRSPEPWSAPPSAWGSVHLRALSPGSFHNLDPGGWGLSDCLCYCALRPHALFPSMMLITRAFRSGHQSSDMPHRCWTCHRSKGECFLPAECAAALWLMECWALFYGRVSPIEGHTPSFQDLSCSACSSRSTVILDVLYPCDGTACWQW